MEKKSKIRIATFAGLLLFTGGLVGFVGANYPPVSVIVGWLFYRLLSLLIGAILLSWVAGELYKGK
ncbi:MAG TPA: hypothetical protein VJH20_04900 [Candidatus Nanoarchaeia archaeon]|nr:hypothetical protein [Candidatus Nanoarchaeia archaeon]